MQLILTCVFCHARKVLLSKLLYDSIWSFGWVPSCFYCINISLSSRYPYWAYHWRINVFGIRPENVLFLKATVKEETVNWLFLVWFQSNWAELVGSEVKLPGDTHMASVWIGTVCALFPLFKLEVGRSRKSDCPLSYYSSLPLCWVKVMLEAHLALKWGRRSCGWGWWASTPWGSAPVWRDKAWNYTQGHGNG